MPIRPLQHIGSAIAAPSKPPRLTSRLTAFGPECMNRLPLELFGPTNLLLDSARSASSIARESGIEGSLFELELDLYLAVRLLARRHSRVSESE
jgi:hypothetical protein